MSGTYQILFIGDVVGRPGREAVAKHLPRLRREIKPEFVIINGENAAGGVGITSSIAEELLNYGADGITLGNHAFHKREICNFLDASDRIVRPLNASVHSPGSGTMTLRHDEIELLVVNLCGRVYLDGYDDPFYAIEGVVEGAASPHIFVDFHAEATSEKIAMALHLDGRASAVVGTHTHVQTADERILPRGTAAITDVGMTGPQNGVLGMDAAIILERFRTGLPAKFEVASGAGVICGVVVEVDRITGRATGIRRIRTEG